MTALRRLGAIVSLWLPVAAILLTWWLWRERLPSALPSHWGSSGPADAVTPVVAFATPLLVVAAVAALLGTVVILVRLSGAWT